MDVRTFPLAILLLAIPAASTGQVPIGLEFSIDSADTPSDRFADADEDAAGNTVVVWRRTAFSPDGDGDGDGVFGVDLTALERRLAPNF